MADIFEVADRFLIIADTNHDDGEGITHMRLQKLLYYVQGFHIALFNEPLFENRIEAWQHGPVVREVWNRYCDQGRNVLQSPGVVENGTMTTDQLSLLGDVWNVYGQFSAWKLRNLTHQESPWLDAIAVGENTEITHNSLRAYFLTQIN